MFQSPERRHVYGSQLLWSTYRRLFQNVRSLSAEGPFHQFVCHVGLGDLRSHRYSIAISDAPGHVDTLIPEGAFQLALSYPLLSVPESYLLLQGFSPKHSIHPPDRDIFRLRFSCPFPSSSSSSSSSSSLASASAASSDNDTKEPSLSAKIARSWALAMRHFNSPSLSGSIAVTPHRLSGCLLHLYQPLYWGNVSAGFQVGADLLTLRSADPHYFAGASLSYSLQDQRNSRVVLALEKGDQLVSTTSDLLEVHSFSEMHSEAVSEKTLTMTAAITNSEQGNSLVTPAWSVLVSSRIVPGLSCHSAAAYFQFFPSPLCKSDCGAVFSYFDNSRLISPQTVLTAAARWHFQHPALMGMESSLSVKLSTGFQDPHRTGAPGVHPANGSLALDITTPLTKLGRSSIGVSLSYQKSQVPCKIGVRLEHELTFA